MRVTEGAPSRSLAATARRAQIVETTIEVIAEVGYAQTTYSRIAERAGLSSTRLISYHFGSRDELMEQVLVDVGGNAQRAIAERVQVEETATGRLRARIEAQLQWIAASIPDLIVSAINRTSKSRNSPLC